MPRASQAAFSCAQSRLLHNLINIEQKGVIWVGTNLFRRRSPLRCDPKNQSIHRVYFVEWRPNKTKQNRMPKKIRSHDFYLTNAPCSYLRRRHTSLPLHFFAWFQFQCNGCLTQDGDHTSAAVQEYDTPFVLECSIETHQCVRKYLVSFMAQLLFKPW